MRGNTQPGPARAVQRAAGLLAGGLAGATLAAAAWPVAAAAAAAGTAGITGQAHPAAARSWRVIKTITGSSVPSITAVTATATTQAWAFESSLGKPSAWQLTGSTWAAVPFPGRTGDIVTAAGSTSRTDVWAFTALPSGSGRALHWNGSRWVIVKQFKQVIGAVTVLGPRDVWIFGQPGLPGGGLGTWHYSGRIWYRFPGLGALTGASALSASNIWAVGGKTAAHWNGIRWSTTSLARVLPRNTQFCRPSADQVHAVARGDLWAVGAGNCQDERGPFYLLHYTRGAWRLAAHAARYGQPGAIVPDGSGGFWIPTVSGSNTFAMLHWAGGQLRQAAMPQPGARMTVGAAAHVPGTLVTFGGGDSYRAGQQGTRTSAVILRYGL